ncbi:MAG: hypothetical protein COA43_08455 [Robiginitomaculum sp.]|nr:MAG: hypothetical protein COA43_08455 [Robiginitomaculum sp.]
MINDHLNIANLFPPADKPSWRTLAEATLRGATFDEALVKKSEDGIALGPLFTQDEQIESTHFSKTETPHLTGRPWHICQRIDHPDISHANTDILNDLNGGVSALSLCIDPSGENGVVLRKINDFQRLFSDVHTQLIPINLQPSEHGFARAALLCAHFQHDPHINDIYLSLGHAPSDPQNEATLSLVKWVYAHTPHWKSLSVNGCPIHEAGASPAQELAFMAFQTVSYIRTLTQNGFDANTARTLIDVHLSSDQDAHQGLIKFRACHALWAKIMDSFGVSSSSCVLHVQTSERMLAASDPWANFLRINSASFAAICGGASYITSLPFTHTLGLATPFARRIARNIQILQMEESRLGHVADPAHGSFMHENLTHALAQKAWEVFQHMESLRGANNDIKAAHHWLNEKIIALNARRMEKIKSNDILLVGVNQFTKSDIREAKTLKRPTISPHSGALIDTDDFATAIDQAKSGSILPPHTKLDIFKPVNLTEGAA